MYPYYAGPDYKYLSDMVALAIYIFCRTALTYVLLCGFPFFFIFSQPNSFNKRSLLVCLKAPVHIRAALR